MGNLLSGGRTAYGELIRLRVASATLPLGNVEINIMSSNPELWWWPTLWKDTQCFIMRLPSPLSALCVSLVKLEAALTTVNSWDINSFERASAIGIANGCGSGC